MPDTLALPTFPDGVIDKILRDRVCARCYGDLVKTPAPDRAWYAVCPDCGSSWHGATVRRTTADRMAQRALADLSEVKHNLSDLFPNPHKGKSAQQILSELGF